MAVGSRSSMLDVLKVGLRIELEVQNVRLQRVSRKRDGWWFRVEYFTRRSNAVLVNRSMSVKEMNLKNSWVTSRALVRQMWSHGLQLIRRNVYETVGRRLDAAAAL